METPVFNTLRIVTTLLDDFLKKEKGVNTPVAQMKSIVSAKQDNTDGVIVNLFKTEEEPILKNSQVAIPIKNGKIAHKNQPVILNLYVLITALNQQDYGTALKDISRIIEFFQLNTKFNSTNTFEPALDFELRHQLISPSNEDVNHIWSVNGGEQLPSLLYKFSLVPVDANKLKGLNVPIESIDLISKNNV